MIELFGLVLSASLLASPVGLHAAPVGEFVQDVVQVSYERVKPATERYTGLASWYDYTFVPEVDENGLFTEGETLEPCPMSGMEWQYGGCWTQSNPIAAMHTEDPQFSRGDIVVVRNLKTGAEVEVVITDTLEHPDRIIDLSSYAFSQIADLTLGLVEVELEIVHHAELSD